MTNRPQQPDEPAMYQIEVQGRLDADRADWFDGMRLRTHTTALGRAITVLVGPVADQAALHGILNRIHALGLTLLHVKRIENLEEDKTS